MTKSRFFALLCIIASLVVSSCKQEIATEIASTPSFRVDSTGDIIFDIHTGDSSAQYLTISNLMSDSITLAFSIEGSTFFSSSSKIAIPPKRSISYPITYFPQREGDDTATLTMRSALGDTYSQRILGHAFGPRFDHSSLFLTLEIQNLFVLDSNKDSTTNLGVLSKHDTAANELFSDAIHGQESGVSQTLGSAETEYLGSGATQTADSISYRFDNYYEINGGASLDTEHKVVNLSIELDTISRLATEVIFETDDNWKAWSGSYRYSTDTRYGFHLTNVPYTRSSDGSLDIVIQGNPLSQSLVSFDYVGYRDHSALNFYSMANYRKHALSPQPTNFLIHINLKK